METHLEYITLHQFSQYNWLANNISNVVRSREGSDTVLTCSLAEALANGCKWTLLRRRLREIEGTWGWATCRPRSRFSRCCKWGGSLRDDNPFSWGNAFVILCRPPLLLNTWAVRAIDAYDPHSTSLH